MSQPTSPVLANSTFAQFDYFASAPILTLSLTASPTSSVSSYSPRPLSTPERSRTPSPCPMYHRSAAAAAANTKEVTPPRVLASPQSASKKEAAARRSVQFTEKSAVNWARPLRVDQEASSSMRLFGASLQRSRRLGRQPYPSPNSSSSEEEPLTPSPVLPLPMREDPDLPVRCWSVGASAKGLGVSGVAEWDTPVTPLRELCESASDGYLFEPLHLASTSTATSSSTSALTSPFKQPHAPTPSPSKPAVQITPPNPRILATSQSLNSFSSPSTLLELQHLRQAASELENEARKPIRVGTLSRETQRERKIKRKAVPSIVEESSLLDSYASASPSSSGHSTPESASIKIPERRSSLIEQVFVPRALPGAAGANAVFARQRQFYQNHLATRSVIEVSPRTKIVPAPTRIITSPIRQANADKHDSFSSSSASLSSDHEPTTPTSLSASQTEQFLTSVENAFRKLEIERAEIQQRTGGCSSSATSSISSSGPTSSKHRRGISRFLGK